VDSVRLVGGGAKNALWCQILASALDAPATCLVEPESAALGAALQAVWMHQRQMGQNAEIDEVVEPFVAACGEPFVPLEEDVALYADGARELHHLEESIWP